VSTKSKSSASLESASPLLLRGGPRLPESPLPLPAAASAARRAACSASRRAQVRFAPVKAVSGWKAQHFLAARCGQHKRKRAATGASVWDTHWQWRLAPSGNSTSSARRCKAQMRKRKQ
jgi:hypothetical protein